MYFNCENICCPLLFCSSVPSSGFTNLFYTCGTLTQHWCVSLLRQINGKWLWLPFARRKMCPALSSWDAARTQALNTHNVSSCPTHPENIGENRSCRSSSGCTQASWTRLLPKRNPPLIASLWALWGLSPNQSNLRLWCSCCCFFFLFFPPFFNPCLAAGLIWEATSPPCGLTREVPVTTSARRKMMQMKTDSKKILHLGQFDTCVQ